jgi:hypothetical protein
MLGLLNTVLSKGNTLLTYVKDGLVMANRFLTPPKLTFPVDASAEFNGTSDYIDIGEKHIANDLGITNAFTFGAWANQQTSSGYKSVLTMWDNANSIIFWFGFSNYNEFHYNISLTGGDKSRNVSSVPINEWAYVNLTYDGANLKLYLNGSLVDNVSATGTLDGRGTTLTEHLLIGKQSFSAGSAAYKGNLANVGIWNRALSSDEINSVMWKGYDALATSEESGLQAWYSLEESELLSDTSTATLTTYANANGLTFEAPACVQTALNGLPDITDARLYSANYDIRVSADGGTVESLSCVETELNAIL